VHVIVEPESGELCGHDVRAAMCELTYGGCADDTRRAGDDDGLGGRGTPAASVDTSARDVFTLHNARADIQEAACATITQLTTAS
jgi:hypothetical protein